MLVETCMSGIGLKVKDAHPAPLDPVWRYAFAIIWEIEVVATWDHYILQRGGVEHARSS